MKVFYGRADYIDSLKDAYELTSKVNWDWDDIDWIAEECAQDYFDNHDGWEAAWPVTFKIFDELGEIKGVFLVELENTPTFTAFPR